MKTSSQSEATSYLYNELKNDEQVQAEIEKNCAGKDERRTHTLNIRFNDFEWERLEKSVKSKVQSVERCNTSLMESK